MPHHSPLCCVTPPYMLKKLLESKDKDDRDIALNTLLATAMLRSERTMQATFAAAADPGHGVRTIYDCKNGTNLSDAELARTEDGEASTDDSVNRAFDGFGATRDFYKQVFDRDSIDDNGMRLDGYVHRGTKYNNAFWNGKVMVFGDGDGVRFGDFTLSLDVIAHELTHGVTQKIAGLVYHVQSGALNESISDVFGSLVKQWHLGQKAVEADWLIGAEVFTPGVDGDALRSMKAPGTAYDSPVFGKDPQPDHMSKFVHLPDDDDPGNDSGGVHYNSGIPNKAFYLAATGIGGNAWETPGHIWFESLKASNPNTQFQDFADTTYQKAGQLYGSTEQGVVLSAWREVGIRISGSSPPGARGSLRTPGGPSGDGLAALTKQIEAMAVQLKALAKDVADLKKKK